VTVNDDSIRDVLQKPHEPYPAGNLTAGHHNIGDGVSPYLARSLDQGKTFEKNVRVAGSVCGCCRVNVGFSQGNVILAWRSVERGDIRDISVSLAADRGRTWSTPRVAARDGWKIAGCPHVGPSMASLGSALYLSWLTRGNGEPGIFLAVSEDGGRAFSPKRKVSDNVSNPGHPFLTANEQKLAMVFEAGAEMGYREFYPGGGQSGLARIPARSHVAYPRVSFTPDGRALLS
jgi:hypothetical protein